MLTLCEDRLSYSRLHCSPNVEAVWTAGFPHCAPGDGSISSVPMLTVPCHMLVAADHVVVCSAWVVAAELGSNGRGIGVHGVMRTDKRVGTERT